MREERRRRSVRGSAVAGVLVLAVVGCGDRDAGQDLRAEDAVVCRELGGELVHVRYETDDGIVARTQLGLDGSGQAAGSLSEQVMRVIEQRGWDDEALEELQQLEPAPEVQARLEQMPSCLVRLREAHG